MSSMTPDFLSKLFFWKKARSPKVDDENISKTLSKWENCVNNIQKILIWENPIISSLSLVAVNILFWLIIYLECKFYGLIFSALLTLSLRQLWTEHIWSESKVADGGSKGAVTASCPESHPRILSVAEISRYASKAQQDARNVCLKLKQLRKDQPGTFCVVTCLCFLLLSVIGRSISGATLLYSLIMVSMTVPGACIHLLPPQFTSILASMFYSSHKDNDNEVEEYLPDTTGETLELLHLAGELQLTPRDGDEDNDILLEQMSARTNDTAESSCSKMSFCPDASLMPSHENSLDFLDFDLPSPRQSNPKKSDSDDSDHSDIHFQSKHFNGDSTDEEEFSKDLRFHDTDRSKKPVVEAKPDASNVTSLAAAATVGRNLLSMGANILTSVVKPADPKRNERESSSDTDSFELISEEDM